MSASDFDRHLRELVQLYDRDLLVPFIGAGMSRRSCEDWRSFVENLERLADGGRPGTGSSSRELVDRAFFAVQALKRRGRRPFREDVLEAIAYRDRIPRNTRKLTRVRWPLVLTTNYDDLYLRGFIRRLKREKEEQELRECDLAPDELPRLYGRSPGDCQRVLSSLDQPSPPILWALQGFVASRPFARELREVLAEVGKPSFRSGLQQCIGSLTRLEDELVVGHAEYRDVAHTALHFRRTFAEVFRRRSLFFLGSGLSEAYFLSLFEEILELSGPGMVPHYALIERGALDPHFMASRFNTVVLEYPKGRHEHVARALEKLEGALTGDRSRVSRWGCVVKSASKPDSGTFEIEAGPLPDFRQLSARECLAISCGRKGQTLQLSTHGAAAAGLPKSPENPIRFGNYVVCFEDRPGVCGVAARDPKLTGSSRDRRSVGIVKEATEALLAYLAGKNDVDRVHLQLLAAGRNRIFPAWCSLVQIARGYRDGWRAARRPIAVRVYVEDPMVLSLLSNGKLDLEPLFDSDRFRIAGEVLERSGRLSRRSLFVPPDQRVDKLANELGVPGKGWVFEIEPAPTVFHLEMRASTRDTLEELGVVPESTVRFRPERER